MKSSSIWAYCDDCRDEVSVSGPESAVPLRAATQALTCNSGHLCLLPDLKLPERAGSVAVYGARRILTPTDLPEVVDERPLGCRTIPLATGRAERCCRGRSRWYPTRLW